MTARINTASLDFSTVAQMVYSQVTAVGTGFTVIPVDDTIPQITEGDQYMTVSVTPKAVGNILVVDALVLLSHSAPNTWLSAAIFRDAVSNALAANAAFAETGGGGVVVPVRAYHTVASLSAITFRLRAGGHQAGTTTFNGTSASRLFGGIGISSLQVMELAAVV